MTCKAMGKLVKIISCLLVAAIIITSVWNVTMVVKAASIDIISTMAGTGISGNTGDGGLAINARLNSPNQVTVDNNGNMYIADLNNHRIRKVGTDGIITTVAGSTQGYLGDGGPATSARLNSPHGVDVDDDGNLFIVDTTNLRVRMVPASSGTYYGIAMTAGNIYTIAGNGTVGSSGDGGPATEAQINYSRGIAVDGAGNLYIADRNNHRIRMVDSNGIITTVAGNGTSGYNGDNIAATSARINFPGGVSVDVYGNLYIADSSNQRIRMVPVSNGNYFGIAMTAGNIYTMAGNGVWPGPSVVHFSGDGGPATSAQLNHPQDVEIDYNGNLYIADSTNRRVRKVNTSGIILTVAGTGTGDYNGDDGPATEANIQAINGIAIDVDNNLYIADNNNHRIRFVEFGGAYYPYWANGYPKAGVVGINSIETLVKTDENGAAYFVALTVGAPAPSSTQVKNGQNASGTPVADSLKGSVAVSANTETGFTATSLTNNTTYDIYVVTEAAGINGYLQTSPAKITVTTLKEPWRAEESCADCHGITAEDFAPAPIDRNAACGENCHVPAFILVMDGWGEDGESPGEWSHGSTVLRTSSLNADPSVLHSIHWQNPWGFDDSACADCHYQASCSACHQDVPHWDHGSSQITPLTMITTDGTGRDWETFSCGLSSCHKTMDQGIQPGTCTTCHTVGKDGHTDSPRTHGDFSASTSACAGCHVAHAAPGPKLMLQPTQTELCFLCHGAGAVGSPYDVQSGMTWNPVAGETGEWQLSSAGGYSWLGQNATTSIHAIEGYGANQALYDPTQPGFIGTIPGGSLSLDGRGLQCSSCHQPHGGSGNARLLRNNFGGDDIQLRMTTGANMVISYDHGFSEWCEACHGRFNVGADAGHIGEDFNGTTYFRHPMNIQVDNHDIDQSFNHTPLQTGKRTSDSSDDNLVVCVTCHRAHGTAATTSGYATTWQQDTGTTGGGSALLRMNNRGVCFNCHGSP